MRALAKSDAAEACPAALAPHTTVTCTVDPYKTASFTLALPQQKDVVLYQVVTQRWANYKLVAPDGTTVACENVLGSGSAGGAQRCATGTAGTYKLEVTDSYGAENAVSVSYVPLLSSTACKAVGAADRKLGAPTVFHGSPAAGSAGDCYTLDLAANDVLRSYASTYRVGQDVYDATGKMVCSTESHRGETLDCKLTGTAPFRMSVLQGSGTAETYDLTVARLSTPEGCAVVEPQAFGAAPDLSSTARCRTLRVAQAAHHTFAPVASGSVPYGALFDAQGTAITACGQGACDLTPGDHTWAVDPRSTDSRRVRHGVPLRQGDPRLHRDARQRPGGRSGHRHLRRARAAALPDPADRQRPGRLPAQPAARRGHQRCRHDVRRHAAPSSARRTATRTTSAS